MSRRGLTLLEVVVAGAIFMSMSVAIVAIERSFTRSARQADVQTEVFRAAALAFDHIKRELRGAYVVPGPDGPTLTYDPPLRQGDTVVLGPSGAALSEGATSLQLDPTGRLTRTRGTETRILAPLGERGSVWFSFPREELLQVTLHAERENPRGPRPAVYDLTVHLPLANQH